MSDREKTAQISFDWASFSPFQNPSIEYAMDFTERQILFWDTMRERGNQYREHAAQLAPHVLSYPFEVIADGRTFERPVNYALVRIIPPTDITISPKARPFVIVDPRAGHGPGIGGFADGARRHKIDTGPASCSQPRKPASYPHLQGGGCDSIAYR